jgi:biotin carboxylase
LTSFYENILMGKPKFIVSNMDKKVLMVVGAGDLQCAVITHAQQMGLFVFVTDGNPQAPGFCIADGYAVASTMDATATLAAAVEFSKKTKIDGVITLGTDATFTVATVAAYFGLPGISEKAAQACTDKAVMRRCFSRAGLPVPHFVVASTPRQATQIVEKMKLPVVIKPVDNMAGRGVMRIDDRETVNFAIKRAFDASATGRIIVEQFLQGCEYSVDSVMIDGKCHILGFADRHIEYNPYFVETGYTMPSLLEEEVYETVEKAALSLGIRMGIAKADVLVNCGQVYILEMAGRLSGNRMSSDGIPVSNGINAVKIAIKLSLGEIPKISKAFTGERGYAYRSLIPPKWGNVCDIRGLQDVRGMPGVIDARLRISLPACIEPYKCSADSIGYVLAAGNTREDALTNVHNALKHIEWI